MFPTTHITINRRPFWGQRLQGGTWTWFGSLSFNTNRALKLLSKLENLGTDSSSPKSLYQVASWTVASGRVEKVELSLDFFNGQGRERSLGSLMRVVTRIGAGGNMCMIVRPGIGAGHPECWQHEGPGFTWGA